MTSLADLTEQDRKLWSTAGAVALAAHVALAAAAVLWKAAPPPRIDEQPITVELFADAAPAAAAEPATSPAPAESQPQAQAVTPVAATPKFTVPPVNAPLPREVVPPPAPQSAPQPVAAPASVPRPVFAQPIAAAAAVAVRPPDAPAVGAGTGTQANGDPRAKKQEADYFALVSAHLNRRKVYPGEAKQARQQGVVTVRFTVDRGGNVTGTTIKRSSGHALLDQATLELLQRVAPLPRMPASMTRDSVTLSLPIDYSLRTT